MSYYVDPSENYPGNYDNYLIQALSFIIKMPLIDWSKEIKIRSVNFPLLTKKKTLVLDLDETLIHADINLSCKNHDALIEIKFLEEEWTQVPVFLRPGLRKFLQFAAVNFEVVCFTSSREEYADAVIDYIESRGKYFSHRLYRNSCLLFNQTIYIKDISIFKNRHLKDVVIVDNSLISFANQISNGILVPSFYHDKNDNILEHLTEYLSSTILQSDDVRKVNKDVFGLEELGNKLKKLV